MAQRRRLCAPALLVAGLCAALAGCAIHIRQDAAPGQRSDGTLTVITGRMNYVVDGAMMTPYGGLRPAWPAPFLEAVDLGSGEMHAFPAVEPQAGRFRWQVPPGAYVVSRIGFGTFTDDTYIAWPRVALCVPSAPGRTVYVGHLRLEGTRYVEDVRLSTGKSYVARGIRFVPRVEDEAPDAPDQVKRLMRHAPDMPTGDTLQAQWKSDPAGLTRRLCGSPDG